MENEAKDYYQMLLETGELHIIYDELNLKGDWQKDKKKFVALYEENVKAIEDAKNLYVDLDEVDSSDDL